jgi:hypothetical protein
MPMPNPATAAALQLLLQAYPGVDTIEHLPHWIDMDDLGWPSTLQARMACLIAYSRHIYDALPTVVWLHIPSLWAEPLDLQLAHRQAKAMRGGTMYHDADWAGVASIEEVDADRAGVAPIETFGATAEGRIWLQKGNGRKSTASTQSWFQAFAADQDAFSDAFRLYVMQC